MITATKEGTIFRNPVDSRNWLPNRKTAEAMLALCQLIQLRDCYNDGWKPDWKSDSIKNIIYNERDIVNAKGFSIHMTFILAFKSSELRNKFYDNFKDLIEIAKPLL